MAFVVVVVVATDFIFEKKSWFCPHAAASRLNSKYKKRLLKKAVFSALLLYRELIPHYAIYSTHKNWGNTQFSGKFHWISPFSLKVETATNSFLVGWIFALHIYRHFLPCSRFVAKNSITYLFIIACRSQVWSF